MDIVEKLKALQTSLFDRGVKGGETISMAIGTIVQLENDRKRFESAYLELRDQTAPSVRLLAPGAKQYDGTFSGPGAPDPWRARLRVWHDGYGEVLRVDAIQGRYDAIREEAETLAALHSLQGIPVDAIERVLREVRK